MTVTITVRDRSFLFTEDSGDDRRTFRMNRFGDNDAMQVNPDDDDHGGSEFVVDKVEARAVFGTFLDDNNEKYLLICRDAELACEIPAEGRFWQITRCDVLAYDSSTVGSLESKTGKLITTIRSFVSSGCFYYSELHSPLLTNSMQRVFDHVSTGDIFNWGKALTFNFCGEQHCPFLTPLMQGYIGQRRLFPLSDNPLLFTLIGRRSSARAGTRFQARGLDDSGNVANFIESEVLVHYEFSSELIFSHTQVRGSVPIFWSQSAGGAPELTRRRSMVSPAFLRHARALRHGWGRTAYVDLLSRGRENEAKLSEELWAQVEASGTGWYLGFDFHQLLAGADSLTDGLKPLTQRLYPYIANFGYFDPGNSKRQTGVIRTNCLDCLDRTNAVQLVLSWEALRQVPSLVDLPSQPPMDFLNVWVEQGDQLSKIYTGSGSVLSRFLRSAGTERVAAFLEQTWRSAERLYDHHFDAGDRQTAIDALLKAQSYYFQGETSQVEFWVGTWNLAGKKGWEEDDLKNLLVIRPNTQMVVLGIQEIVALDLSALLFPGRKKSEIRAGELEDAVLANLPGQWTAVESVTLVGLALLVFVRSDLLSQVGEIWSTQVKAGVGGAAGNKGGVAVGFSLGATPFTFVNLHLDSGTFRAEERAAQLSSILREVLKPQLPGISCLLGDFNFRVPNIDPETFSDYLESGRTLELLSLDEFKSGHSPSILREAFNEGEITFPPTYKFEPGTVNYCPDRTPAWCDRIFFRGAQLKNYSAVLNVFSSDHKPVTATLHASAQLRGREVPLLPNSEEPEWVVLPPVDLLA